MYHHNEMIDFKKPLNAFRTQCLHIDEITWSNSLNRPLLNKIKISAIKENQQDNRPPNGLNDIPQI